MMLRLCIVILLWAGLGTGALAERRVALVIGNEAYRVTAPLANPVSDATAISAALKRLGFEVITGTDLDLAGFRTAARRFSDALPGSDVALFFYAGHGVQVNGQNYLLPVDAELQTEADLDFASINVDLILRQMERHPAVKLVLLDACRNNPFEQQLARSMGLSRAVGALGQGLAPINARGGVMIGFATDPGAVAFDGRGDNSPFTEALLKHIETPGLEINVMMTRVRSDVYAATGREQRPWVTTSLLGEVYLAPKTKEVATPEPVVEPLPQSVPINDPTFELSFWQSIMNSQNPDDFWAYLEAFPDGVFAWLAKNRIADLTTPEPEPEPVIAAAPLAQDAPRVPDQQLVITVPEAAGVTVGDTRPLPVPETPDLKSAIAPEAKSAERVETASVPLPEPRPDSADAISPVSDEGTPLAQPRLIPSDDLPVAIGAGDGQLALATPTVPVELNVAATPDAPTVPPAPLGEGEEPRGECEECPEMIRLSGGSFTMGSPQGRGEAVERPQRKIRIAPFEVSRTEVTVGQFRAFLMDSGYRPTGSCFVWNKTGKMRRSSSASWENPGYDVSDRSPVACVSWEDANRFVSWLNTKTSGSYRMLSEAEFEFAARAGSTGDYFWGGTDGACRAVNGAAADSIFRWRNKACNDGSRAVAVVGSFPANAFGVHDMIGNLWEWTADCWNGSHKGAPDDGRARTSGQCESRVLRGGSWDDPLKNLRSAYRVGIPGKRRQGNVGFRVARSG